MAGTRTRVVYTASVAPEALLRTVARIALLLSVLLLGCMGEGPAPPPAPPDAPQPAAPAPLPPVDADRLVLSVTDPSVLGGLEATLGLHKVLGGPDATRPSTHWLQAQVPRYASLAEQLALRVDALSDGIDRDLVIELADALRYPAGNVGRRLDNRWWSSPMAFFQLAGVVNRFDRRDVRPEHPCGEVRLIYRLAYQHTGEEGKTVSSRLPVTLNIVMVPRCTSGPQAAARQWAADLDTLKRGPLDPAALELVQIEVNAQIVRFPSGLETEFAGQALYLLRVYTFQGDQATPRRLENTPDVTRLAADPEQLAALRGWIDTHHDAIDLGVYQLPEAFLATEALSWSTLGINRAANKPFTALFPPGDRDRLAPVDADGRRWIAARDGLVDRLDNGSCMGCHQASTTAGFHFLGHDDPEISGVTNRLALPFSAHFHAEQAPRRTALAALANGGSPDTFRPHSLVTAQAHAPTNGNCLPDAHRDALVAPDSLRCAEDQRCEVVVSDPRVGLHFGQCLAATDQVLSGQTCRAGAVTPSAARGTPFNHHAYDDRFSHAQLYGLPEDKRFTTDSHNCRPTRIGVPLGRTFRRCTSDERVFDGLLGPTIGEEICAVVGGSRFDSCVEKDFHSCLNEIVGRGMVTSCHAEHFCREDYICQAMPYPLDGVDTERGKAVHDAGVGFCTPTYFVFQLRLDGHPVPTVGGQDGAGL